MQVRMYGAPICPDCVAEKEALLKNHSIQLDYVDITESTANLKEFLKYRDEEKLFEPIKSSGKIGIPFYILENGTKTHDIKQYVQLEIIEPIGKSCSLDGKGNC